LLSELPRCLLAMGAAHIGVNGLACLMTFRAGEARRNRWERVAALSAAAMLATGGEACFTLGVERRHAPAPGGAIPTPSGASARMRSSSASRTRTRRSKAHCVSSSGRAHRLCHLLRSASRERGSDCCVHAPARRSPADRREGAGEFRQLASVGAASIDAWPRLPPEPKSDGHGWLLYRDLNADMKGRSLTRVAGFRGEAKGALS
jgi:hypothetical protein